MYYFYDGTFIGFLSLVYKVFEDKTFNIFIFKKISNTLFEGIHIETHMEKAEKVYFRLLKNLGQETLDKIYSCFLSEENGIEVILLNYIKYGLKLGKSVNKHLFPEVLKLENMSKKVNHEAHKFKGLLRFRKLADNSYFAIISPDHDILPLIATHFIDRFNDQNFVIYDEKRKKALMFDSVKKSSKFVPVSHLDERLKDYNNLELMHKEEKEYSALWKKYFDSIAIEDRKNEKLQKNHIPKKFWNNLVETK